MNGTLELSRLPGTRREARALGVPHYYTGKPCKRGHMAKRHVNNGTCMECHNATYESENEQIMERVVRELTEINALTGEPITREACAAAFWEARDARDLEVQQQKAMIKTKAALIALQNKGCIEIEYNIVRLTQLDTSEDI